MGIPVVASFGTPWEILEQSESGWWVDNSDDSIADTLLRVYNLYQKGSEKLARMGQNGVHLVKECYSQEVISSKWVEVYNWILQGTEKPSCVTDKQ